MEAILAQMDCGPCGYEAAVVAIEKCATDKSSELDLQQMRLSDGDLKRIKFESVTHIHTLNLFLNEIRLTELPAAVGCLRNLRVLRAGANPLISISPDLLTSLNCLEELDIGYGECLEELPDVFNHTPSLRFLLAGNNRLSTIPSTLFSCTNLEELHLYGNCITQLEPSIGKLKRLRVLNVGRNQMTSFPVQLAECKSLERLRAYENCLSALPPGLDDISGLVELNIIANSGLPTIPGNIRALANAKATAAFLAKT